MSKGSAMKKLRFHKDRLFGLLAFLGISFSVLWLVSFAGVGFVLNPSPSAPVGLYVTIPGDVREGEWVIYDTNGIDFPIDVPRYLVKYVCHLGEGRFQLEGKNVYLDDRLVATRQITDLRSEDLLQDVSGDIDEGDAFLLNPVHINSFDSRYYGAVPRSRLTRAVLLWEMN